MQSYLTLTRRELSAYFLSLTGYIVIASTLFVIGFCFKVLLETLQQEPTPMPVTQLFYVTWYFLLILLFPIPVITMRLFALEKFSGTFETLMTAPVRDFEVVLAKFSAAFLFFVLMWLPHIGCLWIVRRFSNDPAALDVGTIASTFCGILLMGGLLISLGCFASALTRSQVTAAIIGLVFGLTFFLIAVLADQLPAQGGWQGQFLAYFSPFEHLRDFARGVIDTRAVIFYVTQILFFLFLTLRVVESRRWK
jgi:ABC-2 type transport system permease protein